MQTAFTGFTTTQQSLASSRTRSNIGALAAVMAVAALTVLVPTRILAQATGQFLPLPAQAKPQAEPPRAHGQRRRVPLGHSCVSPRPRSFSSFSYAIIMMLAAARDLTSQGCAAL
jgi:hypothetical protein